LYTKTFVSLFGGIGGFDLAFQREGWTCAWYNDWDKYAVKTYNKNFGVNYEARDITTVDANEVPDHTLLCAGFPCQSFSIAGKRKGFADTRGTMFFEICRIVKAKRTPFLLLENVKGLLSHDEGRTFRTILKCLDELGYDAEWQVLNSKHFSVPQNRERVFIIANLRTVSKQQVFPITETVEQYGEKDEKPRGEFMISNASEREIGFKNISPALQARDYKDPKIVQLNSPNHSNDRVYGERGVSPSLNTMQGGLRQPKIAPTIRAEHHNTADVHFIETSQALQTDGMLRHGSSFGANNPQSSRNIRRLTPVECARLQGFPDDWHKGMSDSQAYKQYGNSVTVNVVEAIAKRFNEVFGK